ncbi:MAG: metallophosphoesterase family protein, partial [Gammaproteobacteria bacterium]
LPVPALVPVLAVLLEIGIIGRRLPENGTTDTLDWPVDFAIRLARPCGGEPAARQSSLKSRPAPHMKIALLSDTHGILDERVLAAASGADMIIHAGDVGSRRVLELLSATGSPVVAVRGNNDRADKLAEGDRGALLALPLQETVDVQGGRIVATHGDLHPAKRRHERLRARFPEARLVVYGHSHHLTLDTEEQPWVVNPGAAGRSRTFGGPSMVMLEINADRWQLMPRRFRLPARPASGAG